MSLSLIDFEAVMGIRERLNKFYSDIRTTLHEGYFPNLRVGDFVYVKLYRMKKPKRVKLIDLRHNGDFRNCFYFKYEGKVYYLSDGNFVGVKNE